MGPDITILGAAQNARDANLPALVKKCISRWMMCDRIFVEWESGGWLTSGHNPDFQTDLAKMVSQYGPPSKVEFRAKGTGYETPAPCENCNKSLVDCHCDEQQCGYCEKWFGAEPGPRGYCPKCEIEICQCGCGRNSYEDIFH